MLLGRENVNTKRPHSDGSSLSSPLHPKKRSNFEEQDESSPSSFTNPFSPSASEFIDSKFQELIMNVLTTDPTVQNVLSKMINNKLNQKISEQADQISFLQGMVDSLTTKVNKLEEEAERQCHASDQVEQYSRHSVRIVNDWPEEPNEDTDQKVVDMVNQCLNIPITVNDIDRSHRVGPPSNNRTRPVITKLMSYKTKAKIFKARSKLKFAGIRARRVHINEDLTKERSSMFQRALKLKHQHFIRDTWTTDGNIFIRDCDLKTKIFNRLSEFGK